MQHFFDPLLNILNAMSPYLLLGFLFAGILHAFVPNKLYQRYLGDNSARSVVMAAILGVPLPLCSCGVIPTAMSLRRNGASRGATVSFLISTPQTGIDSILATGSLLGAAFAIVRPIVAFVTAIFGGLLVNRFDSADNSADPQMSIETTLPKGFKAKLIAAARYGFVDMMQDIGRWLVIGLLAAAVITVLLPDGFFETTAKWPILNMLIVLAFAIPMYICATGSIPIAVALMLKGLSPGAALVLLMAGPATNLAAIMVVNKVLRSRATIIYLLSIIFGAIGFGLVIDYLLPSDWFALTPTASSAANCHPAAGVDWFATACSVVFVLLLIYAFAAKRLGRHSDCGHTGCHNPRDPQTATRLHVEGMRCNHCKASVINNVGAMDGVQSVDVDLESGTVIYTGTASPADVGQTIDRLGFKATVQNNDR